MLVGLALAACGDPEEPPGPTIAPTVAETPSEAETPDAPRPSTQSPVSCDGASEDPAQLALILSEPAETAARIRSLEALAGAHPNSATTRTRLGEQLLRTRPPSTRRAATWFARALSLHEEGCTLGERDHWATLEGAALSGMMQGEYASAEPMLLASLARWPRSRATRYNLACVRCQTGDVDGCAGELERVLSERAEAEPAFLEGAGRTRDHYVQMAEGDPDLAPLRADADRFSGILTR